MRFASILMFAVLLAAATASAQAPAYLGSFGYTGLGPARMHIPVGLAFDPDGTLWLADAGLQNVRHFSATGQFLGGLPEPRTSSWSPQGVAVLTSGEIAVASAGPPYLLLYGADRSSFVDLAETAACFGVVAIPGGGFWYSQPSLHRVQVFRTDGSFVTRFGTAGSGPGQFLRPAGVAVGPDGTIYVSDPDNDRVSYLGSPPTPATATSWGRIKTLFR